MGNCASAQFKIVSSKKPRHVRSRKIRKHGKPWKKKKSEAGNLVAVTEIVHTTTTSTIQVTQREWHQSQIDSNGASFLYSFYFF